MLREVFLKCQYYDIGKVPFFNAGHWDLHDNYFGSRYNKLLAGIFK
jgi:hypothetical protein